MSPGTSISKSNVCEPEDVGTRRDWLYADQSNLLTAEEAFCACLMWLPPAEVLELHDLLRPDDFESPHATRVHALIGGLARDGIRATSLAIYHAAVSAESARTASQRHELTRYVTTLYGDPSVVPCNARYYATRALEQALRRRTTEMAARLGQVVDHADVDALERLHDAEQEAVRRLRDRFRALAAPRDNVRRAA